MTLQCRISNLLIKSTRLYLINPRVLGRNGLVGGSVVPTFSSILAELNITIIGSRPNGVFVDRRFSDRENGAMVFGAAVVSRKPTRFILLLFFGVVGGVLV